MAHCQANIQAKQRYMNDPTSRSAMICGTIVVFWGLNSWEDENSEKNESRSVSPKAGDQAHAPKGVYDDHYSNDKVR